MNTDTPHAERFEDRLLAAILDDLDNLTAVADHSRLSGFTTSAGHRHARRVVPAVVATAAAAGLAVVAVTATDGHLPGRVTPKVAIQPRAQAAKSAGPVMDLASYRLQLPDSYRLTSVTNSSCPVGGVGFMSAGPARAEGATSSAAVVPGYASQMTAAANEQGACLYAVLAPPYTPTAANPDPEAGRFEASQPVQVGPYEGRAGTWTAVAKPSGATSQEAALYVELPAADGQAQDLAVSSYGLSESALISLVAGGLSATGGPHAASTATRR